MIDLSPAEKAIVKKILQAYLPEAEVMAFGSRVTMQAKPYSDLDLVARSAEPVSSETLSLTREAFQESELTFRVDLLDWARIDDEFRAVIQQKYYLLQAPA